MRLTKGLPIYEKSSDLGIQQYSRLSLFAFVSARKQFIWSVLFLSPFKVTYVHFFVVVNLTLFSILVLCHFETSFSYLLNLNIGKKLVCTSSYAHSPVTTRFTGPFLTSSPQTILVQPYVVWSDLDTLFKMNTIWHPFCWEQFPAQWALDFTESWSMGLKRFPFFTSIVMYLVLKRSLLSVLPQTISSKFFQSLESPNLNSHWNLAAEPNGTYNVLGGSFVNFVPAFTEKRITGYFSAVLLNPGVFLTCNE